MAILPLLEHSRHDIAELDNILSAAEHRGKFVGLNTLLVIFLHLDLLHSFTRFAQLAQVDLLSLLARIIDHEYDEEGGQRD